MSTTSSRKTNTNRKFSSVGLSLDVVVSPSLVGIDLVVQGLALDAAAVNGFFASSEAWLLEVN